MARITIDWFGTKRYFNDINHIHREDGPAYIHPSGGMGWYNNGQWVAGKSSDGQYECYTNIDLKIYRHTSAGGLKFVILDGYILWPEL